MTFNRKLEWQLNFSHSMMAACESKIVPSKELVQMVTLTKHGNCIRVHAQ